MTRALDGTREPAARRVARGAFALFMIAAGVSHFVNPEFFLGIVPPWLPAPGALVAVSGAAEVVAGIGVLLPRFRRAAGLFAITVLLAVFPANVWMAVDLSIWPEVPVWARWARLPFQFVFIWWAWVVTRDPAESSG